MPTEPAFRFVLLRHGQSEWNLENRFTGWTDVALTEKGRSEARLAAQILKGRGLHFDLAFTSALKRAVQTLEILCEEMNHRDLPILRLWQLNERHYGSLQGLNKAETAQRLGLPLVMRWRRSYSARPPMLEWDDHRHPRFDPLYRGVPVNALPAGESLQDTEKRLLPGWEQRIRPAIQAGLRVLVVAHGNSLRALVRFLEQIPPAEVPALDIPTGVPLVFGSDWECRSFTRLEISDL